MKVEIIIDEKYVEPEIKIYASRLTDEIVEIQNNLSTIEKKSNYLKAFLDEDVYLIPFEDIESIYSENKKVLLRTEKETYILKQRLYEIESILPGSNFVRISNSEIVNFKKVKNMNFKFSGTILINFISGNYSYVSRRYIKRIKEYLDM